MKNKFRWLLSFAAVAMCVMLSTGFAGCSKGEDEDDGKHEKPVQGLVSANVPSEGWSGTAGDGICTYRSAYQDEDFSTYYAFSFENGKCKDAVYNIVCESEAEAKQVSDAFNSGQWIGDEDDDDEDFGTRAAKQISVLSKVLRNSKVAKAAFESTRAANVMGITCTQEGKVVYFKIEAMRGLNGDDVQYVMKTWDTGLDMNNLPSKPIFGTWDEATGKYTSNSINAIPGTKIEIETAFDSSDMLTKYVAKFIMPNEEWAVLIEEALIEEAIGYEEMFGITLDISRNGSVITANNVSIADSEVDKATLVKMIVALDILNARPIETALF